MPPVPSSKIPYVACSLAAWSHWPALCALYFPKSQIVFLGQGWPQSASASERLKSWNFFPGLSPLMLQPWTGCSLCVYSQVSETVYPHKFLQIRIGRSLCRTWVPCFGRAGATKLCFLSSALSFTSDTSHRVFPMQLVKSLIGWGKVSSVLPGFKISHLLRFQ